MTVISLQTLLQPWVTIPLSADCVISGLSLDSRTIQPGNVYFALTTDYISEAIQNGAVAVITENQPPYSVSIPVITIDNLREKVGLIAARFFNNPSKNMRIIGVTGTNGKTSTTHFIAQALKTVGFNSALIGTIGNGIVDQITESTHTTPDAIALQALLAHFHQQQADYVALETSSHGLDQYRTAGTEFFLGIFTNLTRDHLDYHKTMKAYARAKFRLFEQSGMRYAILNADDDYGKLWIPLLKDRLNVFITSIHPDFIAPADIPFIQATQIHSELNGLRASIKTPWGDGLLQTPLLGKFNVSNILNVIATLGILNFPLPTILQAVSQLKTVPGRMHSLGGINQQPLVIIDYAHTPDALEKTLLAIREHCQDEIWCIFGCGGDRDRGKRPMMGQIAEQYADQIIITDDNPRHENPAQITAEICEGISRKDVIIIEHDRRRAIAHAIQCAKPHDVVLIAGKGHENYQIIGEDKISFSDLLEAKMALMER